MSLTVRLDEKTSHRLASVAHGLGRTKSAIVKEALLSYLEDMDDWVDGVAELKKIHAGKSKLHSLKKVKKYLEMEDKHIG